MAAKNSLPTAKVLASVHSRVHYCRDCAIVQLRRGLDKIICRDNGMEKRCDLYLGDDLLLDARIGYVEGAWLKPGLGNGVMQEEVCRAAEPQLNQPFEDLPTATAGMAPLMGLLASGLYLVADCLLQPVTGHWHSLNMPYFHHEAEFISEGCSYYDAPLYLMPTRRAADLAPERIRHYMEVLQQSDYHCPRAVALYLNGGVTLLLDGHHKAAAAAALGKRVRTLVICPLENEKAVDTALRAGKKLDLYHGRWNAVQDVPERYGHPMYLMDEEKKEISRILALQFRMPRKETVPRREAPDWGSLPEEFCTGIDQYPDNWRLRDGTAIPPDRIKAAFREIRNGRWYLPPEPWMLWDSDCMPPNWLELLESLIAFAALFPDSSMLTETDRLWLEKARREIERLKKRTIS